MLPKRKSHTVNQAPNNHRNQIIEKKKERKKLTNNSTRKSVAFNWCFFRIIFSFLHFTSFY